MISKTYAYFIDIDGVLLYTLGQGGYYEAWLGQLATRFSGAMHRHGLPTDGQSLLAAWSGYKRQLETEYGRTLRYEENNAIWLRDPRNETGAPFGPVSFFGSILGVDLRDWMRELEETTFARQFMLPGAMDLWQAVTESSTAVGILLSRGEPQLQTHKAVSMFGPGVQALTHVIQSGIKCNMINNAMTGEAPHNWLLPSNQWVSFNYAVQIEDSQEEVGGLEDRPDRVGFYLPYREGGQPPNHILSAHDPQGVVDLLRAYGVL